MASAERSSIGAGLIVALIGLVPVVWLAMQTTEAAPNLASTQADSVVVEVAPPEPTDLDPAVARVLYSSGNALALGEADLVELPEEVVRVLVYYDVALAIPTEGVTP